MNQIDLKGKRAVVTGGAQGIGRAIAERFLSSGASVSLWDRDESLAEAARLELAEKGEVAAVAVDLTDLAAVEAARDQTNQTLGGIDILVNNAGIAGPNANLWDYPPEAWRDVIDIDLNAVFLLLSRRRSPNDRAKLRANLFYGFHCRKRGQSDCQSLCCCQSRCHCADQSPGKRTRRLRHCGELHHASCRQNPYLRPDRAGIHRLHAE